MLGSYMEDIGIKSEQFEKACGMKEPDREGKPQIHHSLFEQVNDWAPFIY